MMYARQARPGIRGLIVLLVAACAMLHWLAPMAGLGATQHLLPPQRAHFLQPNVHSIQRAMLPVSDLQVPTPRVAARTQTHRWTEPLALRPHRAAEGRTASLATPLRI
jgi:hypothetical protein